MCGICGLVNSDRTESENIEIIKRMCDSMIHRGPDDWGFMSFGKHCIGMRRLSIIDTSSSGHQPMPNEDNTIWVICNGEIYNFNEKKKLLQAKGHRFRSGTDIEVIVHLYEEFGIDCIEHLRGMFTFALWDTNRHELYLARDRLGIKHLYFHENNGRLAFSSELRPLITSGLVKPEINLNMIDQYLSFGYVPQPDTLLNGVQVLNPAHVLRWKGDRITIKKYWDFPEPGSNDIPHKDVIPATRQLLEETVALHKISDVPIGAFLSGGIDSTTVVGLMAALSEEPVRTFSIGFQKDVPARFNELHIAKQTAARFGTQHSDVIINGRDVAEQMKDIIRFMDQPSFDGINTYFVSQAAKAGGLTVALSGLGGDELFGGYDSFDVIHRWAKPIRLWGKLPRYFRRGTAHVLSQWALSDFWKKRIRKIQLLPYVDNVSDLYILARMLLWPHEKQAIYSADMCSYLREKEDISYIEELIKGVGRFDDYPWHSLSCLEMTNYMGWRLLRDTDVMSMAHSLEVRVPFVDNKLVEFICGLPLGWEKHWGYPKKLLVESLRDLLPYEVLSQPKHGFEFPFGHWMKNELKDIVEDVFSEECIKARGLFEYSNIRLLYDRFLKNELPYPAIWQLVVLELWMREILDQTL